MQEQQKTFQTADGTALFYRYRPAQNGNTRQAIILFHRGHEHSGRMMFVADELGFDDFAYFAWDARGHGNSPGERGDSPSMATSIADIQDFVHHIEREYGIPTENIAVIGAWRSTTPKWRSAASVRTRSAQAASPGSLHWARFSRSGWSEYWL